MEKWEHEAEARIAQYRQADFRLRLCDADGAAIPAARVRLQLVRHDFRLGANGFLIRGSGGHGAASAEDILPQRYEQRFAEMLNYATLPFYWGGYEPEPGKENAERLRSMAEWCYRHGVACKGHPLAWHEVFPQWAAALGDEEVWRRLRERIKKLVADFRGLIDIWDVVNEATVSHNFDNAVGRRIKKYGAAACVAEALALAREANPQAELLYNDFNISPAYEELLAALQKAQAPIDAIGIQSHMHKGEWTMEKTWEVCDRYSRFGLPLHFTEVTILSGRHKAENDNDWHAQRPDWPSTPEAEERQLEAGRRFYTLLFSHPAVDAITWWDFSDRRSWQGAPAGLLRQDMTLKPLAKWLCHAFGERWSTRLETRSDENGWVSFRGFYGTYTVAAIAENSRSLAGACSLPRRSPKEKEARLS